MAALTASRNTPEWSGSRRQHYGLVGVEAATSIYVGSMVCRNSNGNAVKAQAIGASPLNKLQVLGVVEYVYAGGIVPPGIDALNQTGNASLFPGTTSTIGNAGSISVGVVCGTFGFDYDSTISTANVGELCFATDDHTLTMGTLVANTTSLAIAANTVNIQQALIGPVVQGTVTVTANSGGTGTIYQEGNDYLVDYGNGYISYPAAGALNNANVTVFISYYHSSGPVVGRIIAIDAGQCYVDMFDKAVVL